MKRYATVMYFHDGCPEFGPDITASSKADALLCAKFLGAIEIMELVQNDIYLCGFGN